MDILITLPHHFARHLKKQLREFPSINAVYSDPEGHKLGSGGGTVNVLRQSGRGSRCIIIHSDGQSRRLPSYAPSGKSFIPFPVFKWGRGQQIDQTLFDVQRPLLEKILSRAPAGQNTLVVSGDSLVWTDAFNAAIPEADVVCAGVWADAETASKHGVFVVPRQDPSSLEYMLQKPSIQELQSLSGSSMFMLDAGIWLLSERAVDLLFHESGWDDTRSEFRNGIPDNYDLYSDFGKKLGSGPGCSGKLSAKIIPLDHAEFYHFGSNADLLRSTRQLHERVLDQRGIWHKKIKPSADIFVQNASTSVSFRSDNTSIWIENSCIPQTWILHDHHIITGIPENRWHVELPAGTCLDFTPVNSSQWCIRPYGFHDSFKGGISDSSTLWLNRPAQEWFDRRGFRADEIAGFAGRDIYECQIFPVVDEDALSEEFLMWLAGPGSPGKGEHAESYKKAWLSNMRFSSREIIGNINHGRLGTQRRKYLENSLTALAANYQKSVFYQLDLNHLAAQYRKFKLPPPAQLDRDADVMTQVHNLMFRAALPGNQMKGKVNGLEVQAFTRLREGMLQNLPDPKNLPVLKIHRDQILWARSPVRLDLAGGWTDTPPFCLINGGNVVNMAVELNGQPPIQVYLRLIPDPCIVIRSIDLGVSEVIRTFDEISEVHKVGSAFSIPKAALMLAGFHPDFSVHQFKTLKEQLRELDGGIDISLMVAVPKGSGLGTSSILASTLLGGLSDICSLGWDRHEIAYRTLLLEQLLTTGGGWQDQLGGIFEGVKLIESQPGLVQRPNLSWAPDHLFTRPETKELILLYYTGINRVAKKILTEIVRGMFLNSAKHIEILSEMKHHALNTYETIRHHDWKGLTSAIRYSWELNNRLDSGTCPPEIEAILNKIKDHTLACKLLGAGGGGYLMIFARDIDATFHIRSLLSNDPPNKGARFVSWELSSTGMEITKS